MESHKKSNNRSLEALDVLIDIVFKLMKEQKTDDLEVVDSYIFTLESKIFLQQPYIKDYIHKGCEVLLKATEETS